MRKFLLLLIVTSFGIATYAQKAGKKKKYEKTPFVWKKGGMFSLSVNQGGYDNWIPAGDADWSIGLNGAVSLFANKTWTGKKKGKAKAWNNSLDVYEAIQNIHDERTDGNQFSKLDDRLDFLSRYTLALKNKISFSTVANLRSQLYDTRINKKRISGFFAPAVVTFAPGFEWKPCSAFSAFLSPFSNRWVVVSNGPYSISQNLEDPKPYGVDPARAVDWQPGAYAQFNLNADLDKAKKINLKSRLDLYSNYAGSPEKVDIYFTNFLNLKVNKWISAGISLTMIYDDDIKQFGWDRKKAGLQYNHLITIGVVRKF
jgi:hypothetical protein